MAVIDHEVHERTKQKQGAKWGCWNLERRREPLMVKDGFYPDGRQRFTEVPDFGSLECRNDISLSDPKCVGCRHAGSGEEYSLNVRTNGK